MSGMEDEAKVQVTLADYVSVIWRRRWMIVSLCLTSLLGTVIATLLSTKVYEATATLVAPREGPGTGLLGSLAAASGIIQQIPISMPSFTPNRDLLLGVLKSRTITLSVSDRFKLRERYRVRYTEDAIKALRDRTSVTMSKEGVIVIRVADVDPAVAAEMANFYVTELDRMIGQYAVSEARGQRAFLTAQLVRAKADLAETEEALRGFQERNRAVVLQEQTRGAIEGAARLKAELIAAQVQLRVMSNFATDANPEVVALRRRIDEMTRQLGQMQYGDTLREPPTDPERRDFGVPLARLPKVGLELARLMRNAKTQETLVALLAQQVEQAQIAEARDMPVVQVLDRAAPPERPAYPRWGLNLTLAAAASLVGSLILAFALKDRTRGGMAQA